MAIILDIAAVLLFLFFLWLGKKRGFIKTVAGILVLVLAFWGAGLLADILSPAVSKTYVTPWVSDFISPKVEEANPETPSEFEAFLRDLGVPDGMANDIVTARPISELVEKASVNLAEALTHGILYLVFFIVLLILLKLLFKVIDKIFDLPVLNFANNTLGLICGGIWGFLVVFLVAIILNKTGFLLDEATLSQTYVLKHILSLNPFKL